MDPVTRYMNRRNAERDAQAYYRADGRARRSAGRINTSPGNVAVDTSGKRVAMPTSYQLGAGTVPAFQQSRADRVKSAMADGSFGGIRSRFNESNAGKQVMDEQGNIRASNPYMDGGQLEGTNTPAPKPETPAPTAPAPKPEAAPRKPGIIMDGDRNVAGDIRKGLAGNRTGSFYTKSTAPKMDSSVMKQALAVQNAAKGINTAQAVIDKTPRIAAQAQTPPADTINQPLSLGPTPKRVIGQAPSPTPQPQVQTAPKPAPIPMVTQPTPAQTPKPEVKNPAAAFGAPTVSWSDLNPNNKDAWVNDPLGFVKRKKGLNRSYAP